MTLLITNRLRHIGRLLRRFIVVVGLMLSANASAADTFASIAGHWEGYFVSEFNRDGFTIDFESDSQGQTKGWLTVANWGPTAWPLRQIEVKDREIQFQLDTDENTRAVFAGSKTSVGWYGKYRWKEREYPFVLMRKRDQKLDGVCHPQLPCFPVPYTVETVEFVSQHSNLRIGAGLTIPKGSEKHLAVLLLTGSRPAAWRPAIPGALDEPVSMLILADLLTRAGYVTMRLDSRGFGRSEGKYEASSMEELTSDAIDAMEYLRTRNEVRADRVGLLGMSQGALVALAASGRSRKADFLILMACCGAPLDQVFLESERRRMLATGFRPDRLEPYLSVSRRLQELAKTDLSERQIREIVSKEYDAKVLRRLPFDAAGMELRIQHAVEPVMRSMLRLDPVTLIADGDEPVLVLHGAKDLRVPLEQNVPPLERALKESKHRTVTVKVFSDLSHTFFRTTNGLEWSDDVDLDHRVVDCLISWLGNR